MTKPKTFEEAQANFEAAKTSHKEAKEELREFSVENKIKKDKTPEDPKLAKKHEQLVAKVEKTKATAEEARDLVNELKPRKVRETKYEYPEGMTDQEKKKFRAAARRKAKNPEKENGKENGKTEKAAKKPLKKEAPEKEPEDQEED